LNINLGAQAITADPTSAARFGIPDGFSQFNATVAANLRQYIQFSSFEGQAARRGFSTLNGNLSPGGSRWFEGADETVDHPTASIRVGSLSGVDTVWAPIHHTDYIPDDGAVTTYSQSGSMQCFGYLHAGLGRQADVKLTWSGGNVTVRDETHHLDVPFSPLVQSSYGFVVDGNGDGVIGWRDFDHIQNVSNTFQNAIGFCANGDPQLATQTTLANAPTVTPTSTDGNTRNGQTATGSGFGLYINGERYIFELPGGALPADGTEWTLRTYAGIVSAQNDESSTPTSYNYAPTDRSPIIPGLSVQFTVENSTSAVASTQETLDAVHTLPDPYYVTNAFEVTPSQKVLKFVNLPEAAIIRIYSLSGTLVDIVEHSDATLGGEAIWDVRNRNNQFVASGVYFYHVETPEGLEKVGRFTVVNASGIATGGASQGN
jgi:hypothetical protein